MRIKILSLMTLLLHFCILAAGQSPHQIKGSLIYKLGQDTAIIGNFQLTGNNFKLTVLSTAPNMYVNELTGSFFSDGQLQHVEGFTYNPVKGKDSSGYTYQMRYERDTTYMETKSRNKISIRKYPVKIMVANNLGGDALVLMPALLTAYAPKRINDSLISNHIVFNSARKFIIKKTGDKKLSMGSSVMGIFTLYLDKNNQLQSVDGIGTSFNIKGKVGPYLNMDSVISANVIEQQLHPRPAAINKFDSVKTTINSTVIRIIYSRPSVRARVIFGEVVPWNRIWRTGADAATKISLSKSIYFNGKELPAGEYSIFTIPSKNGWTLIFNKQANIWGTEHNADFDFLKIPMVTTSLPQEIEMLTFSFVSNTQGGEIAVSWDKTKASVNFLTVY